MTSASGAVYQAETDVDWDDDVGGSIRVTASIHAGFDATMTDGFLIAPDGAITADEVWEGS